MTLWQTVRVAGRALGLNKVRSFLTTLGIVIGVAAVIAMVAIGEGAKSRVEETFAAMGTHLLLVIPGSTASGGARGGMGSLSSLTWADFDAISQEVSEVRAAAPVLRTSAQIMSEDQNWTTSVQGTTPRLLEIRSWRLTQGSAFTASDVEVGAKMVLLGTTVVSKLYGPGASVVGETVRIKNVPFQVIGVLAPKGQSPMGQDYDDVALIPTTTYRSKLESGLGNYLNGVIFVSAVSQDAVARVERRISLLLRDRHRLGPGAEDDFWVRNLSEVASAQQEGAETLSLLLASIAVVALLVGGIGIMNIMLVSVTERTREIGLRMAVGASPRHILAQFLVEALTLAFLGGLIGVAVGVATGSFVASRFQWAIQLRLDIMLLSVAFSALVGVVFGLYPAIQASRLDPIEALRYE
ncbi:MAG: ABC transporter permease [Myxococcaceae bacterium]